MAADNRDPTVSSSDEDVLRLFPASSDEAEPVDAKAEAEFWIGRIRDRLGDAQPYTSRTACAACGTTEALLITRGNQNTVRCASCGTHLYNAPKTETGQSPRTVETLRRGIKPSQQARIMDRDHARCLLCGTRSHLTIGHLLSVDDGARFGALESELYDDANLAVMCEACNLGLGRRSVSLRTFTVLMYRLLQAEIRRNGPNNIRPLKRG